MIRDTDKPIRVHVLDREYVLRVTEDDEAITREIAAYVDARMRAFRRAHPEQPELTAAIITALAIAEDLFTAKEEQGVAMRALENQIGVLDDQLAAALQQAEDASVHVEPDPTSSGRTTSE